MSIVEVEILPKYERSGKHNSVNHNNLGIAEPCQFTLHMISTYHNILLTRIKPFHHDVQLLALFQEG